MQIKPYSRGETLPVPLAESRGPLAERTAGDGYGKGNGFPGYSANGHSHPTAGQTQPHAHPATSTHPSYLQVLIEHCFKRWKLLGLWMALTGAVAYYAVGKLGKPLWRAEGNLYFSRRFRSSSNS